MITLATDVLRDLVSNYPFLLYPSTLLGNFGVITRNTTSFPILWVILMTRNYPDYSPKNRVFVDESEYNSRVCAQIQTISHIGSKTDHSVSARGMRDLFTVFSQGSFTQNTVIEQNSLDTSPQMLGFHQFPVCLDLRMCAIISNVFPQGLITNTLQSDHKLLDISHPARLDHTLLVKKSDPLSKGDSTDHTVKSKTETKILWQCIQTVLSNNNVLVLSGTTLARIQSRLQ